MTIKPLMTLLFLTSFISADFGGIQMSKPRATSNNGLYHVAITPFQGFPKAAGACNAQMFRKENNKHILVWSRHLINDYRPCELLVTDKGQLITLDDSERLGRYPVVIYSKTGRLRKITRLSDFPELEYNDEIDETESGCRWRESSTYYLSQVAPCLVIAAPDKDPIFLNISSGLRLSQFSSGRYKVDWLALQAELKERVKHETIPDAVVEIKPTMTTQNHFGVKLRRELDNEGRALVSWSRGTDTKDWAQVRYTTCPKSSFEQLEPWNGSKTPPKPIEVLISLAHERAKLTNKALVFGWVMINPCEDDKSKRYVTVWFHDPHSPNHAVEIDLLLSGELTRSNKRVISQDQYDELEKYGIPKVEQVATPKP